ncbi:MAG TPA: DEAD/DEAH box helicase [Thermomicrobiales bacterium]|nr:DEAD/DEAH box helicase [Thermomicrobiales bacterium]
MSFDAQPTPTTVAPTTDSTSGGETHGMRDRERAETLEQFSKLYPFPLDRFQIDAIDTFLDGDSVMVAAPTGTGKTVVAELGVYESFRRSGRVIYTTPIKALSNQKFRDLRQIYGDSVGLLTGDVTENARAPIVVMTTEVMRNMLLQSPWELDGVDCVIFDEVHYIADTERGTTWEEAIILCPEHIQLICLSATVSNAEEIAAWIARTHRPIRLITHYERAIPLALYYYFNKKLRLVIDHNGDQIASFPDAGGEIRKRMSRGGLTADMRRQAELDEPQPWEILLAMAAQEMLPAIYFLFSRRDCQDYAQRVAMMKPNFVRDDLTRQRIDGVIEAHLGSMREEDRDLEQVRAIVSLAAQGIGFHHAGLLPILKQLVEVLFTRGLLQVVFATDTLALGVNMPARSVVIGRMTKWDGRSRRQLIPNEFQQMAGRAGRRGMDLKGNIVVPHSPWIKFNDMLNIATGELEPVISAFSIRYNTVLNLWDPPHGDRVRHMLQQSLAQFQSARRVRELEDDIVALGARISEIPQGCLIGLDAGDELLDDYRGLDHTSDALRGKERGLLQELRELSIRTESRPWPEPGRQAIRKFFRTAEPGIVVHTRADSWGVFVGRARAGGVGLFLFGESIQLVPEYRMVDYLPSRPLMVELPESLTALDEPVADLSTVATEEELARVAGQFAALPLPDLEAQIAGHRLELEQRYSAAREKLLGSLQEVREQIGQLNESREQHPCHTCPRRKEHLNNLRHVNAMERERGYVENQLQEEMNAEAERIRGIINGIRNVLHRFNYLHRGYPTAKADLLADVFDTNGLVICEMLDRGMLDSLSAPDMAEVFSWFAFDRDSRFQNTYSLPNRLVLLRRRLEDMEQQILASERSNGLFISAGHNIGFYGAMRAWCTGATISAITEQIALSEGDLVLTFNKTIDLMRQVREMLANVSRDHPVRVTLTVAERLVKRDIVEQSLAIGFLPIDTGESEPQEADESLAAPVDGEG